MAGKIITTAQLPRGAVPAFLAVGGLFDADWRLAVACRDGNIYTIKVEQEYLRTTLRVEYVGLDAHQGVLSESPAEVGPESLYLCVVHHKHNYYVPRECYHILVDKSRIAGDILRFYQVFS